MFKFKKIISLALVWGVILLGVFLRAYKADTYPVDNNDDGLFYVWAGNSFLDNPLKVTSHSIFDADNKGLIWRAQYKDFLPVDRFGMKIVRPWFDHPPLGTVLASLPARMLGYRNLEQIPQLIVRYPALIASIFTLLFTYLLAKRLFKDKTAGLALLFMATIPYMVVAHRQSFLENFLTPLFLLSLIWLLKYTGSKKKTDLIILGFLSFLTGWIKVVGFAIPLMIGAWLVYKKRQQAALVIFLTGAGSILSYLGYGLLINAEIFKATLLNQGVRGAFVSSLFNGITVSEFYGRFNDGWYLLGFIFILALLLRKSKKYKFFNWFTVGWLLVMFLTSGRLANSPWYRYPLLPFMAMAIGVYINKLLKKPSIFLMAPIFLLGLTGFDLIGANLDSSWLRLVTVGFWGVYVLKFMFDNKLTLVLSRITSYLLITFIVILNIWVSLRYSSVHCTQELCLQPQKIILEP